MNRDQARRKREQRRQERKRMAAFDSQETHLTPKGFDLIYPQIPPEQLPELAAWEDKWVADGKARGITIGDDHRRLLRAVVRIKWFAEEHGEEPPSKIHLGFLSDVLGLPLDRIKELWEDLEPTSPRP